MIRRLALATLLLSGLSVAAVAGADAPVAGADAPAGQLLLKGGGEGHAGYWPLFFELAGGKDAAIVILPTASERPEAGQEYVDELAAKGATNVRWLPLRKREDAMRAEIVAAIREARGVFFGGGDQSRITAALLGTPAEEAVRAVHARGGVLGGTSAGLACMSAKMLTGNGDFSKITAANVELVTGLGFVTEAILDQHFVARSRHNRLLSVVLENPSLLGVGVDERTTVRIGPDRILEVLGDGVVVVYDARGSAVRRAASGADTLLAADELRTRVLVAGDRLDLASGRLLR